MEGNPMSLSATATLAYKTLEWANKNGASVDIYTETDLYEHCDIVSLSDINVTDGMVDFVAMHPVKDCQHDFRIYFTQIRSVIIV